MALMAAIKSTISANGFVASIDLTNFGLLGGTVEVTLIMSSNLHLHVVHLSPSAAAMLKVGRSRLRNFLPN